jgi:hypothetical protein
VFIFVQTDGESNDNDEDDYVMNDYLKIQRKKPARNSSDFNDYKHRLLRNFQSHLICFDIET